MKKVVNVIGLIVLILVCMMGRVNAEEAKSSAKVSVSASKKEVNLDEQFSVNIRLSDIKSELGILAFGGTLEYDKKQFEMVKMEGLNDWESPKEGFTYNSSSGTIAITKNGFAKENENIVKITFKVKDTSTNKGKITINSITLSDATEPIKASDTSVELTLKGKESTTTNKETSTSNKNSNTNKDTTKKEEQNNIDENLNNQEEQNTIENEIGNLEQNNTISDELVQTSVQNEDIEKNDRINDIIVIISTVILVIVAIVFMVRVHNLNKRKKRK